MSCEDSLETTRAQLHERAVEDYHNHGIVYLPALSSLPESAVYWGFDELGDILCTRDGRVALLSYVGCIVSETSQVSPDGGWTGRPRISGDTFADLVIAFHVNTALKYHNAFLGPSIACEEHLESLKKLMLTDDLPIKQGAYTLPFRHKLFKRKPLYAMDLSPVPPAIYRRACDRPLAAGPVPSWFTIDGWPVASTQAQTDIVPLKSTHQVCPLPAYDESGLILPPTEYESVLPGALVNVIFTLRHSTSKGTAHYFNTALEELSVIRRRANRYDQAHHDYRLPLTARFPLCRPEGKPAVEGCNDTDSDMDAGSDGTYDIDDSDDELPHLVPYNA